MRLVILVLMVTTLCSESDYNTQLKRIKRQADTDDEELDEMVLDNLDVIEIVTHKGVPLEYLPIKVPLNVHRMAMETQVYREDLELDRQEKIAEFRKLRPDAPEPAPDQDLIDFHIATDSKDTPDEIELDKGELDKKARERLEKEKQKQRVFDKIQALGSDIEKLVSSISGSAHIDIEELEDKNRAMQTEVHEITDDDVDDELTDDEDVEITLSEPVDTEDLDEDEEEIEDIPKTNVKDIIFNTPHHRRSKRFIVRNAKKHWEKGLVPFEIIKTYDPDGKIAIEAAMARYEKFTCVRFVPWDEATREKYGLSHDGRLFFRQTRGCWSHIGNIRVQQPISCCQRSSCLHELGHALGLMHEHRNPLRSGWNRINYRNIIDRAIKWYYRTDPEDYVVYGYDLSSPMHFKMWGFRRWRGDTQAMLFHELSLVAESNFYMFHEIVDTYNCRGLYCTEFKKHCVNDGYVSVINGKCSCMCPEGLDPATGCSTVIRQPKIIKNWPRGTYALLASDEGCPDGFQFGTVSHWFPKTWKRWKAPNVHLKSEFSRNGNTYGFCVRTSDDPHTSDSKKDWPRGNYCILRKGGMCPEGFEEGSLQFFGRMPPEPKDSFTSGTTPDGKFGQNPLFQFCCKNSGFLEDEMELPNEIPFTLFFYQKEYRTCQHVKGMYGTKEEFYLRTLPRTKNTQTFHGVHPQARQWFRTIVYVPFCYYRPYKSKCGGILQLTRDEPMMTLRSPNFPKQYSNDLRCYWLIKSPPNTTIVMDFDSFSLEESNGKCKDSLEIGHVKIGQPGAFYCGDGFQGSIHSVFNMIKLTLRTSMEVQKPGFKATFKVIFPNEMCYSVRDHGTTYRGRVNFTRSMEPCLPWSDVTMCKHHAFKTSDVFSGLDYNYCRNPGNGFGPWCYIRRADCVRDYCDVCLTERLFDKVDNCEELKKAGFCSLNVYTVLSQCAKTCAKFLPPVEHPIVYNEVECTSPDHVKDANIVSDNRKKSYSVGEVVKLMCLTSRRVTSAQCLTSGRWSVGPYICGACALGWAFRDGYCYKYFDQRRHYSEATLTCRSYGGTIALTRTEGEEDFVTNLREQGKTIWHAATDREEEGNWVYPDGKKLIYKNWKRGQPNDYKNEDCAIIMADKKWNDVKCFWYEKHRFVCQYRLDEPSMCKDRRRTCQDLLRVRPTFCFDFPDFAKHECHFTCGFCDTESDSHCALPKTSLNTTFVETMTKGDGFTRGDTFTHACIDGYVRISGNAIRACIFCGLFTGKPLVCLDIDDTTRPNNNVDLILRKHVGKRFHYYTGDSDDFFIERNGEVIRWEFFTRGAGTLSFQVWRPVEDLGANHFELVGENTFRRIAGGLQVLSMSVAPEERIRVRNGDQIGVYFGYYRAQLTYDYCNDMSVHVVTLNRYKSPLFKVDDIAKFTEDIGCVRFSLRAVISPLPPII